MAAYRSAGSRKAAFFLRHPRLLAIFIIAAAVVLQTFVFAAHTATYTSLQNNTFSKNNTPQAFDFNFTHTGGADNITNVNITLPAGFLLGTFGNLSGAGFACTNVSSSLVNCSNSSANGLNPAAPSVIIQVNATPQTITGAYYWTLNTTDTAGEVNGSVVATNVDADYPACSAFSVNDSFVRNGDSINFTATCTDAGTNISSIYLNLTSVNASAIVQALPSGSNTFSAVITADASEGNKTVYILNVTDFVGNTNSSLSPVTTVVVDLNAPIVFAPTVNVSSPTKMNTNFFINTSYSDGSGSGVSNCTYNVTNSSGFVVGWTLMNSSGGTSGVANATISAILPDGNNSIYVNCSDAVGWTGYSPATVLTVDTLAPAVNVTQPSGGWYNGTVLVRLTVNDSTSGVVSVVFFNGSAWASAVLQGGSSNNGIWNGTINTNAFADGTSIVLNANATDLVGNNGSAASVPTIQVDNNPPVVLKPTLNVSSPTRFNTNIFVNSTFNDGGQGLAANACRLYVTGATSVSAYAINNSGGGSGVVNGTIANTLNDGTNNIYLNCTDQQGWTASNYTSLIVDTVPPGIAIQSPVAKNYSTAAVPLNFTVGDINGVSSCKYEITNSSGSFNVSLSNCQNLTLSGITQNSNSVKIWANDSAGNWNASASVSFTVDTIFPVCSAFSANASYARNGSLVNFTAACSDVGVGIDRVFFNLTALNSSTGLVQANPAGGGSYYYALSVGAPEGSAVASIFNVSDLAGNLNSSLAKTASVAVDNINPSVSGAAVNVSYARTGTPINVSALITDTNLNTSRLFVYNSTGGSFAMSLQAGNVYAAFITVSETGNNPSLRYNISAYDNASNLNSTAYVTFNLDNTAPTVNAPTVNVSSPTRLNKNFFINTSYNDTSGSSVVACSYNVTNSSGGFAVAWTAMNYSTGVSGVANATISATLPDGANSIYVRCTDGVGLTGYSGANALTVDTKAPSWNQTPSSQTVGYGAPFSYQVNASDVALGSYYISDSANFSINPSSGLITNNTLLSIGAHPLAVYVNDTAGNLNSSSFTVTVSDSTFPVVSNITATPSTGTAGISISINATIADVPPLVVKAKVQYVNKTNYAVVDYALLNMSASGSTYNATWSTAGAYNGTYLVDINATDGGGNRVIVNDGASIALGFNAQSAYSNSSVSTDSLNQTTVSSANVTLLIQANNSRQNDSITIVKYADDPSGSSLGNSFGATEIGAFADVVSSISGSNLTWALIKIYYTDAQLGILPESKLGVYYWNGAQWQRLKVGMGWVYAVGVNTTDNYVWANVSHLSLFAAAGDEQGPQASGIILSANPTYTNITFTALLEDVSLGGSDISSAEYYIGSDPGRGNGTAIYPQDGLGFDGNKSETVNGTINVDALSNGAHTLYVRGKDAASNWGSARDYPFTVNKTAPTMNSISINNNAVYTTFASVTLSLSASGAFECAFSNDASNYSAWYSYAPTAPWTLSGGDGTKTVYYKCKNSAGLEASPISDSIVLDTTAPAINITAPAAETTVNGNYSVNFTISDANGVSPQNVSISVDGGDLISTNSNFTYWWNTTTLRDGPHNIQIRAVDSAGKTGDSLRLAYVNNADQIAPVISSVVNGTVTDSLAVINWSTNENSSSQVEYGLSVSYGFVTGELDLSPRVSSHSINLTSGLSPGTLYHYRVKSRDASGNLNISADYNFTTLYVDSSVPSVAIISPRGSDYVGLSKAISISASDASGINPTSMLLYKDGSLLWTYSTSECTGAGTPASPYLCSWLWNTTEEDDGVPHTLMLSASDNAGKSQTHSIMIYVDRVMPLVYPNSPSNNQYLYVSESPVNFTVARGSQGLVNKSSIFVILDGQQAMDFSPSSNCSLTEGTNDYFCSFRITKYAYNQLGYVFNSSLMLGNHSLMISASDLAGNNAAPLSVNFTLLDENDTVSLTGLTVDKPSAIANGVDYWQYTFSVTLGSSAGTRVSFKLADWSDGYGHSISSSYANLTVGASKIALSSSYQYSIPVSDTDSSTAGVQASLILKQYIPTGTLPNQYFTSYGIKTLDSENPTLSSTAPANNSFINYALSNVTATFSDDSGGSGVYLDGSAIALSNESGLVAGTKTNSPPSALVLNFSSPLPDGNYTIATLPKDRYGNAGSLQYSYFVLDRVLPTAATLDALPIYTTSLRVSLNWSGGSDERSGVSHYQLWRSSGTFVNIANTSGTAYNDTSVQDGVVYHYNLSTVDRAGNARFSTFLPSTTIDITTPAAPTVAQPSTPTNIPAISVSGTAEAYSNVSIYINGALERTTFTASGSFSFGGIVLSEGVNIINATATDLAGLVSGGSNKVSVLLDTTPPAIGSLFPADGSNISSARPEISAVFTESGSGVNSSSIIMLVDAVLVSHSYEPASKKVSYTPTALSEAVHNISVYTRDLLGYSTLTTWSFRVDLTPPPPVSGLSVIQDTSTTMNLSWSVSPALDFSYFRIYRKEVVSFTNVSQATFVNNLTSTSYRDSGLLPSRPYHYAVTAVDSAGNENATVTTKYNTTLS